MKREYRELAARAENAALKLRIATDKFEAFVAKMLPRLVKAQKRLAKAKGGR